MSIRLEMIQVGRLAPKLLGEAANLVEAYLLSRRHDGGGFMNRYGQPDLYYSVFALDALCCLQSSAPLSGFESYLDHFGDGADLDFVHLCCLIRCASVVLGSQLSRQRLKERLLAYRSLDGGFHPEQAQAEGTAYGCFLGVAALQDLGVDLEDFKASICHCLGKLKGSRPAWGNEARVPSPSTNATAAAMTTLRQFGEDPGKDCQEWLLAQSHPMGGFKAAPMAPIPDLLSTATALHALAGSNALALEGNHDRCLDFIDSLWTNLGGFHGHWHEDEIDPEYTFYGLLALGHLSD